MLAAFATVLVRFTSAVALTLLKAIAIAMVTNWTHWVFAEALAMQMQMPMVFATMQMSVWVLWMLAAFAMVQVKFTNAVADIPEGDCDCNGNQVDASGDCGGAVLGRRRRWNLR